MTQVASIQIILRWVRVIAINLVILSLLIVGLEAFSSMFIEQLGDENVVPHDILNHRWKPNSSWQHDRWGATNPDFSEPYMHYYNAQGWLETYDVRRAKDPDIYRIFYLGDSFTEGTVSMAGSVPSLVERALNTQAQDPGMNVEIINTGTMSYSPTIFYLLVRHVLLDYDPDLLVVNIDMTDDFDDWKYRQTLMFDDDGNPWASLPRDVYASEFLDTERGAVRATLAARVRLFLFRHSYTYHFLGRARRKFFPSFESEQPATASAEPAGYPRWAWCQEEWDAETSENVAWTLDLLRRLVRLSQSEGVKLMLTSVPHYQQYAGSDDGTGPPAWSSRPHEVIAALAEESGVPYLNSFEALRPYVQGTPQTQYYYSGDMHFNPRGYELWATAHTAFLLDETHGLLPASLYPVASDETGSR